jgi:pimeloyl-ACP methyl ester carboxylesterase
VEAQQAPAAPPVAPQQAPAGPPVTAQEGAPDFLPGRCASNFDIPDGFVAGESVRCGVVQVPQSRTRPDLPPLSLPVAVLTAPTADAGATPLIYLAGGPGGSGLEEVSLGFLDSPLGQTLVRQRPVIAFDQRGTGRSLPSLSCTMMPMVDTDAVSIMKGAQAPTIERVLACREELEQRGVDLASFNTTETSHDVRDIIHALGYEQAILMGTSYGTTGVLFTLRNHPEVVESAILDGVAPPQWLDGYEEDVLEDEADLAFRRFLRDCERDTVCDAEYPNLREQVDELLARSNERIPIFVDEDTGRVVDVSVGALVELFREVISIPSLAEQIPLFISGILEGDTAMLREELGFLIFLAGLGEMPDEGAPPDMPQALRRAPKAIYDAVLCADFPPGTPFGGRAVCDAWGVPYLGPQVSEPVESSVPALLLSGNYDFQTPPIWAEMTASTLPNSHSYLFPAAGHVVTYSQHSACVAVITLSFIAAPLLQPADTCIDELQGPRFLPRPDRPPA